MCLCVLAKKENLYIKYFLDIYKRLGFNHIFIYDNNDVNEERIEDAIKDQSLKDFISIINYRGYRGTYGGPQMAAYYDCYERNYKHYDWMAFFDVDEYLMLNPRNQTIQEFLNNSRFNNCESIKINWKLYSDNNALGYEDKPLNERFTEEINESSIINTARKVIIRGNLENYTLRKNYNPHDIFSSNRSCDSNGKIRFGQRINPPEYKTAILNHYFTKSINEFCRKIKRGHSFHNFNLTEKLFYNNFVIFFRYNKKTKEKVEIFNKNFNTTFI